jgi:hypothetical protein
MIETVLRMAGAPHVAHVAQVHGAQEHGADS